MTPSEIRALREGLGLTQPQFARLLGLGAAQRVAEYESGTRRPSGAALLLLMAYRDGLLSPDWLGDGASPRSGQPRPRGRETG